MKLLADDIDKVIGTIKPPGPISSLPVGEAGINQVLSSIINIIMAVGGVIFLFMIVIGAFQWITSGGDKEAVQKARSRITNAIIGIAILALSFVIVNVIGQITGFKNIVK